MIEQEKIDEIAYRLRGYEQDNKPRYFNLYFTKDKDSKNEKLVAEKVSGEKEFRKRVNDIIKTYLPYKIIVKEFNAKARNIKEPVEVTTIEARYNSNLAVQHHVPYNMPADKVETKVQQIPDPFEQWGGLAGFKQEVRSEVAKEYQIIREQEEKKKLIEENEKLKKENRELVEDNTKLFEVNQELGEKVQELQKYVPENLKIGDVSVVKVLGSILGTAAEAAVKNVVVKRPEKVKEILGDTAFEQISGLFEDDPEEDETEYSKPIQELQSVPTNPEQESQHMQVADAIHELNKKISSSFLGKIQLIYYFFLNDDETINEEKLNKIIKFINKQKEDKKDEPE